MIIPWDVDVPQDRRPVVNWLFVVGIVAVFVIQFYLRANTVGKHANYVDAVDGYVLNGFNIDGLFGHMWLHGGILHTLGTCYFCGYLETRFAQKSVT